MKKPALPRIETGVRNLDALLHGGLPKGSVSVFGGSPGAGKTTLAQQICFHYARANQRVLWFSTLSEPTAKTLLYLSQFSFFDGGKIDAGDVQFVDLGVILRTKGLDEAAKLIMQHVKRFKPAIVVIDSFKVFDDLAKSRESRSRRPRSACVRPRAVWVGISTQRSSAAWSRSFSFRNRTSSSKAIC